MSKVDGINTMNNYSVIDKMGALYIYFFSLYVKMSESTDLTYYQKSRDMILNQEKYYY